MQQNNQNQSNINPNTKSSPLASEQVVYCVDISIEIDDCLTFADWLNSKGHHACVVDSECSFIDGLPVELYNSECLIFNDLRLQFKN